MHMLTCANAVTLRSDPAAQLAAGVAGSVAGACSSRTMAELLGGSLDGIDGTHPPADDAVGDSVAAAARNAAAHSAATHFAATYQSACSMPTNAAAAHDTTVGVVGSSGLAVVPLPGSVHGVATPYNTDAYGAAHTAAYAVAASEAPAADWQSTAYATAAHTAAAHVPAANHTPATAAAYVPAATHTTAPAAAPAAAHAPPLPVVAPTMAPKIPEDSPKIPEDSPKIPEDSPVVAPAMMYDPVASVTDSAARVPQPVTSVKADPAARVPQPEDDGFRSKKRLGGADGGVVEVKKPRLTPCMHASSSLHAFKCTHGSCTVCCTQVKKRGRPKVSGATAAASAAGGGAAARSHAKAEAPPFEGLPQCHIEELDD